MNLHIQKKGKNNSKGFYIALGVCLIAVGIAAWTTYDSVVNYAAPESNSPSSATKPANNTVSGVFVSEAPSSAVPSSQVSSAPASSATSSAVSKPKPPKTPAKATDAQPWTYSYPVSRTIVQKFSEDPVFCKTTQDWRAHAGLDLSAKQGDPVKAIAAGKVEKTYVDDKYGNTAVIMHGNVEAWYCGLKDTKVKAGDNVTAGQEIGTVGSVPIETDEDSHLHLMLMQNGKYVDPLSLLK